MSPQNAYPWGSKNSARGGQKNMRTRGDGGQQGIKIL